MCPFRERKFVFLLALLLSLFTNTERAMCEDVTSLYITDADLSANTGAWTLSATGGSWTYNTSSQVAEAYAGWASLSLTSYSMKQSVTLPSGTYRLSANAFYRQGISYDVAPTVSNAYLVAGDESVAVVSLGSLSLSSYANDMAAAHSAFAAGEYLNTLTFSLTETATIDLGFEGTHDAAYSWFIAGAVTLETVDADGTLSDIDLSNTGFDTEDDFISADQSSASVGTVTGWTDACSLSWGATGVTSVGSQYKINGYSAPSVNSDGVTDGGLLGMSCGWSGTVAYTQGVTLPAGYYNMSYVVYNSNANGITCSSNLFGFVADDGTAYYDTATSFSYGEWTLRRLTFRLDSETSGLLSVGFVAAAKGSGSNPVLFIDGVTLYHKASEAADFVWDDVHYFFGRQQSPTLSVSSDAKALHVAGASGLSSVSVDVSENPNALIYARAGQVSNSCNVVIDDVCDNLGLSDGYPFAVPYAFTATAASYTLDALAGGEYATLILPFDVTDLPGAAYVLDKDISTMGCEIYATSVSSVSSDSPVLVTASGAYSASQVPIGVRKSSEVFANGHLAGVYEETSAPVGSYVLQHHSDSQGVAFYIVGSSVQPVVRPFHCYMPAQSSQVVVRVMFEDAEGVNGLSDYLSDDVVAVYDLTGAKVKRDYKGIRIVKYASGNVKKVMFSENYNR